MDGTKRVGNSTQKPLRMREARLGDSRLARARCDLSEPVAEPPAKLHHPYLLRPLQRGQDLFAVPAHVEPVADCDISDSDGSLSVNNRKPPSPAVQKKIVNPLHNGRGILDLGPDPKQFDLDPE